VRLSAFGQQETFAVKKIELPVIDGSEFWLVQQSMPSSPTMHLSVVAVLLAPPLTDEWMPEAVFLYPPPTDAHGCRSNAEAGVGRGQPRQDHRSQHPAGQGIAQWERLDGGDKADMKTRRAKIKGGPEGPPVY
jgi:hypothetical protein